MEISHRSKTFMDVLAETTVLFRELGNIPENYEVLYVHGGAQMQFSAIPLNLMGRKPARKALYLDTGNWTKRAIEEAKNFGEVDVVASSAESKYDHIPDFSGIDWNPEASYVYICSNNTLYGTRYSNFPQTGDLPLVADMTSEIFSRQVDFKQFGVVFAGTQKNLGPSGLAMVIIRQDLLGQTLPSTPMLLDYEVYQKNDSMANTPCTFTIYVMNKVLKWLKEHGGVATLEKINEQKAKRLYDYLDQSDFYSARVKGQDRSVNNVVFDLKDESLMNEFLKQAEANDLYALKGHRVVGGARASIYNAMPLEGVQALVEFMEKFAKAKR